MKQSVFFDLDGTLTNSRTGIINCIKYALTQIGAPVPPPSRLEKCIGIPLRDVFVDLVGSQNKDLVEKAVELYRERFEEDGMFENAVYPGIVDLLRGIRQRRWRAYVVTSKSEFYAKPVVSHFALDEFFVRVYGSELDGTRAGKGELIRYVLEQESISCSDAVMVGDRYSDVAGALSNGLVAIGVTYGYGSREELLEAGATWICDDATCVLATLAAHFDGAEPHRRVQD